MTSSKFKRFKFALKAGTFILAFLCILFLLVLIPPVQNKIVSIVTERLSEQLNTQVTLDKFYFNFLDEVCFQGLYIEDQSQDTLVYAQAVYADLAFWKLLWNKVEIHDFEIVNPTIRLKQEVDESFNFQFLLDAFASSDTTSSEDSSIRVDLDRISLLRSDIKVEMLTELISFKADDILLKVSLIDLENSILEFNKLSLQKAALEYTYAASNDQEVETDELYSNTFPLVEFPFDISLKELQTSESSILYKEVGAQKTITFDPKFINLLDFSTHLEDMQVNSSLFKVMLTDLSVNINDEFQIDQLKSDIALTDQKLSLVNSVFLAGKNSIYPDLNLQYNNFDQLSQFDSSIALELALKTSKILPKSLGYFLPSIYENESLAPYISKLVTLEGKLNGSLRELNVEKFLLDASETKFIARGMIKNPLDIDRLSVDKLKLKGDIDYSDYKAFISDPKLKNQVRKVGRIDVDMFLDGSLSSLDFKDLNLKTESLFSLKMNGTLNDLLDSEKLSYQVNVDQLTTGKQDASIFLDSIPSVLDDLDTIKYSGTLKGNLRDISMNGDFASSLGPLKSDLSIVFNNDYTDAKYKGEITTLDFDAGRLLDQDSLGRITMDVKLDGSGLSADSITTLVEGTIRQVTYNSYRYEQIQMDGTINGQSFEGTAGIDDENIKFSFNGSVDINDSIPEYRFELLLDTISLQALNLSSDIFNMSAKINANLTGSNLDNIVGQLKVKDIFMTKQEKSVKADSMLLYAEEKLNERELSFTSKYGTAEIVGDYKLELLDDAILDFFDRYFPMKTFLGRSPKSDMILNPQELKASRTDVVNAHVEIFDIVEIAQFFDFPMEQFDSSILDFKLEIPEDLTTLSVYIPKLIYDGYFFDSIYFAAKNDGDQLYSNFKIDSVSLSESVHSSGIKIDMLFENQSARIKTLIKNNENIRGLGFTNLLKATDNDQFSIRFIDRFILNDKLWQVQQDSSIILTADAWNIPPISISNGSERLEIEGTTAKLITDFENFDIKNFVDIIGIDSLDASGIMDGELMIGLNDEIPLEGNLIVKDLQFNEYDLGTVDLLAIKEGELVDIQLNAKGTSLDFGGSVNYNLDKGEFQGQLLVSNMDLAPYNPLVSSYFTGLKGKLTGDAFIEGTIEKPSVTGVFNLENVSAKFVPLATSYKIQTGTITLFDEVIQPNITLIDEKSRTSYLDGDIYHYYFEDLQFDLTFDAEAFTFLDSPADKSELFYGKFVGKVYAEITGDVDLPIVFADVQALSETEMTVQILANQSTLIEEDYIVFYDQNVVQSPEELDSLSRNAYQTESAVDLNLRLSTTPQALYHVIVDPLTGDRLDIRGEGDLIILVPNQEDLSIIGELKVVSGNYRLSYENIVKRNFALDPGSRMVFTGDPYEARLDMRAIYKTSTNTYALVQNASATISDGSVSNKTLVEVLLYIKGTISKPELNFDIQIPESSTSPVGSSVNTALTNIRQSETLLLEQVFSLILFNSFSSSNSSNNFSNVGTSAAVSSVGSLINSQLNRLTQTTSGLELNFALDQYQDQGAAVNSDITEVNLGVQQKLFNDRLIVSAGGNANLGITQNTQEFSRVAGDFVVTYLLTKDGSYRIKVFQKSDFDAISTSSVWRTGVGLSYKNKFGKINKTRSVKEGN